MLQTHLENLRTEQPIVGVHLSLRPCRPANQQLELFESDLRDPNCFFETLGRLSALVGHDRVGTPIVESSHRADAFRLEPPNLNPCRRRRQESLTNLIHRGPCLRRFRPPVRAAFECRILHKAGPWEMSGDWWDHKRWSRVEWDIETEDEHLYRVIDRNGEMFVDGLYD